MPSMSSKGPPAVTSRNLCELPQQTDESLSLQYAFKSSVGAYVYFGDGAGVCVVGVHVPLGAGVGAGTGLAVGLPGVAVGAGVGRFVG